MSAERIDAPDKNWKFSAADITERGFWGDYMTAYGKCLEATSTKHAPWHVVPADDKLNARLVISHILLERLEGLKMVYPMVSAERRVELQTIRRQLEL